MFDEQKLAFETAKGLALNAKEKRMIMVNGGPVTGKSVISINLLGSLLNERKNAIFVAPNASLREVMISRLNQEYDAHRIKHLLKGSASFYATRKNTFDVIIVDEAHRV